MRSGVGAFALIFMITPLMALELHFSPLSQVISPYHSRISEFFVAVKKEGY